MAMSGVNVPWLSVRPLWLTDNVVDQLARAVANGWHTQTDLMVRQLGAGGASAEDIAGACIGLTVGQVAEILGRIADQ